MLKLPHNFVCFGPLSLVGAYYQRVFSCILIKGGNKLCDLGVLKKKGKRKGKRS